MAHQLQSARPGNAAGRPTPGRSGSRTSGSRITGNRWLPYLYIAPALLFLVTFVILPLGRVAQFSLYDWNGVGTAEWVGLDNYVRMLGSRDLRLALLHSLVFIFTYSVLPIGIGLLLAGVLGRRSAKGFSVFRSILFIPQVTTMVAVGVAWRWMYAGDGTVNQLLRLVGVSADTAWLGSFTWALPAVGLIGTWVMSGFCMLLLLAGMGKIDTTLYDAVRVDGGGAVREFFTVTLPGLRQEITVATIVTLIGALRTFDVVYATTLGGPGDSTVVPGFLIYRLAFRAGDVGGASTVAILLILMVFAVVLAVSRLLREKQ